jgi:glycosyltransferase involved in cell wall biosynthesis
MRIAIIHNHSLTYQGGGEKFVLRLAIALKRRGVDVIIHSIPIGRRDDVTYSEAVPRNISYSEGLTCSIDADASYVTYFPFASLFLRLKIPAIAGIHSPLLLPELQDAMLFKGTPITLLKRLGIVGTISYYGRHVMGVELRKFVAVHVYSSYIASRIPRVRTYVIPSFINTDFFKPTREKGEEFTALFVGRRMFEKGFDVFFAVARIAKRLGLKARFCATGGRKGEVVNGVESLGYVPEEELKDVYSAAHVVLYLTRADTWGQVILESLACGTPVITSDIPTHRIPDLPVMLTGGAAEAVRCLIDLYHMYHHDRDAYFEFCKRCREAVAKFYEEDVVVPQYLRMFEEVAEVQ